MKPQLIGIAPQLRVPDVVKTAEYYIKVLGFNLINYFMDPPVYAMIQRDGFQIHFGKAPADQLHTNLVAGSEVTDFVIWVPEIELFYNEVKAAGADIKQDIVRRSYGREFLISDCDGHIIMVCD
ncbi:MAG: VOC family protein [Bacteroidota bacterium]